MRVPCRAEHATRVKIINGPDTSSKTAEPIRRAARRRGKKKTLKGKPKHRRLRSDAHVEELGRIIFAVGGRATCLRAADSAAVGVITNKETETYWLKHKALPAGAVTNHFGNVRGSNALKDVDVLFTICHHLAPPTENERTAAAIFARDPDARVIGRGMGMRKETQHIGVRLNDMVVGVPVNTLVQPCKQINEVIRAKTVGEDTQATGAGTGHSARTRQPAA